MTNLTNIEVELKFPLLNPEELTQQLNSIATPQKRDTIQKDTYYIPPHRNFLRDKPISEWLRIRETKDKFTVNYKKWHNAGGKCETNSCDELETGINNVSILKQIFSNLNFKDIIIVEKLRNTWHYKNVEIAVDKINELGFFIEVEAKGNFKDIDEAKVHLFEVIKELNAKTGPQDFKGYPHRLLERSGHL